MWSCGLSMLQTDRQNEMAGKTKLVLLLVASLAGKVLYRKGGGLSINIGSLIRVCREIGLCVSMKCDPLKQMEYADECLRVQIPLNHKKDYTLSTCLAAAAATKCVYVGEFHITG